MTERIIFLNLNHYYIRAKHLIQYEKMYTRLKKKVFFSPILKHHIDKNQKSPAKKYEEKLWINKKKLDSKTWMFIKIWSSKVRETKKITDDGTMNWNQFDVNLWFNQWGNEKGSYRIFVFFFSLLNFLCIFFATENENKLGRRSVCWINWCENQKTIYIWTISDIGWQRRYCRKVICGVLFFFFIFTLLKVQIRRAKQFTFYVNPMNQFR